MAGKIYNIAVAAYTSEGVKHRLMYTCTEEYLSDNPKALGYLIENMTSRFEGATDTPRKFWRWSAQEEDLLIPYIKEQTRDNPHSNLPS